MRSTQRSFPFPRDPLYRPPVQVLSVGCGRGGEYHRACKGGEQAKIAFELVTGGRLALRIDSVDCSPRAGDLIVLPYDRPSDLEGVPGVAWSKSWFVVEGSVLDGLLAAYDLTGVYHVEQCPVDHLFRRMLRIGASSGGDRWVAQKQLTVTFYQLLVETSSLRLQRQRPVSTDVLTVKNYLDSRLQRPVCLDEVSEFTHLSKAHLIRRFKREIGLSPYAYLLNQKLEHAKLLLSASGLRVKEVAERVGFSNEYHFSSMFKQKTGVAPSYFREEAKGNGKPYGPASR